MNGAAALCAGYGGLDLALEAVTGARMAWCAELDPNASKILDQGFPGVPNHGDLTTIDWAACEPVEWLTAGYPCQPFSHAGKRKGTDDSRHLWPYVADAVRVLRPRRCLFENVGGHLSMGMGDVLGDLAALGYDTRWVCLRAADVGAPHGRLRVFIVATDASGERRSSQTPADTGRLRGDAGRGAEPIEAASSRSFRQPGGRGNSSPTDAAGDTGRIGDGDGLPVVEWGPYKGAVERWERVLGRRAPNPTESGRNGPRLSPVFVEWLMGLPAGWVTDTGITRNAQLKALGNGVVPQQAAAALRHLLAARGALV